MHRFDIYIAYFQKLAPTDAEKCEELEPEKWHANRGKILAFQRSDFSHFLWLSMGHNQKRKWALFAPLKWRHPKRKFRSSPSLSRSLLLLFSHPPLLPNKASTFSAHFCSKSRKEGIFGVVKRVSTCGTSKFQLGRIDGDPVLRETRIWATWEYVSSVGGGQQGMSGTWRYVAGVRRPWGRQIVMAAQLIHDRVEMECLEGAWETLEGNARCRFRGTIRFTATSLVHPDEPVRTLQRTVEWILPTPTPYRLVEPVQVIEVTSSEEDPEEDPEELPPEPAVDALDFLEGDEDPLPEVDSPEDVMSASEADSTEDSGPREMTISGGSSS
ncbi:hypothetical protein HKD37_19G053025 [Glycine soja]